MEPLWVDDEDALRELVDRLVDEPRYGLDTEFLWECSGGDEFAFESLAREYCGRAPSPTEAAGILFKLHGAPMYFYRKGKGRYRAAPPDIAGEK